MDINFLVKLSSKAWALDVLALLNDGVSGRQAPLLAHTSASRTSLRASLDHLIALKLLERNPGHGHPLRSEFVLTANGRDAAQMAGKLNRAVKGEADSDLMRRAWTVPILAVTGTPRRFNEIKVDLRPITDRALSQSLQRLEVHACVSRHVDIEQRPVRPTYQAVDWGARINQVVSPIIAAPATKWC